MLHRLIPLYVDNLRLVRGLSPLTIEAYSHDVATFVDALYPGNGDDNSTPIPTRDDITGYLADLYDTGISPRSIARIISSLKSFFKFLTADRLIDADPTLLIESPTVDRHLPDVLSVEEIDAIIETLPADKAETPRNRAIIETLYGSGLRVSELTNLRLSRYNRDEAYLIIDGKGAKQRIVPVSFAAVEAIEAYLPDRNPKPDATDILFLNRRGAPLTRQMIFTIIRNLTREAGINKNVSPHTLRHCFATHMLEGGANLRVIQQLLGHESVATTEIYLHLDRSHLRSQLLNAHPHYRKKPPA